MPSVNGTRPVDERMTSASITSCAPPATGSTVRVAPPPGLAAAEMTYRRETQNEVDALGVITISRGCFERCCSKKTTPPYHSNLSFVALRNQISLRC